MNPLIATFYMQVKENHVSQAKAGHLLIETKQGDITLNLDGEKELALGAHVVQCVLNSGTWQIVNIHQLGEVIKNNEPKPTQSTLAVPKVESPRPPLPVTSNSSGETRRAPPAVAPSGGAVARKTVSMAPLPQAMRITPQVASTSMATNSAKGGGFAVQAQNSNPPKVASKIPINATKPSAPRPAVSTKSSSGGFTIQPLEGVTENTASSSAAEVKNAPVIHVDKWDDSDSIPF